MARAALVAVVMLAAARAPKNGLRAIHVLISGAASATVRLPGVAHGGAGMVIGKRSGFGYQFRQG